MNTTTKSPAAAKKDVTKLQRAIVDGLEDVKAQDIQVFNTEALSPLFERVIVATGSSNRQTKALAASVRDAVREAGFAKPRVEGEDNGEWIIVDCGAAVAHIMQPAIRQYYRLEEIWGEKPVKLKLGASQPKPVAKTRTPKAAASEASAPRKAAPRKAAGSAAAPAAAAKPTARKASSRVAAPANGKPAAKAPARAAGKAPAKTPAKAPAKKAVVKTVVVKPEAKKAAAKPRAASASKPAPRKAPARKTSRGTDSQG